MIAPQLEQKIIAKQTPAGLPVEAEQAGTAQWAVASPASGVLLVWKARHGDRVREGDTIAEVRDTFGNDHLVAASADGTLRHARHMGAPVQPGSVIANIAPLPQEPIKRALPIAPPPPAPKIAPAPSGEALEASEEVPRRSTLGDADKLVEVEELSLPVPIKPTKRPRRPRVAKRTCHPTNHQVEEFKAMLERLGKRGHDYSAGELERLAFHLLLSLPEQELVAAAEANRDREVAGRYGYGVGPRG